MDLLPSEKLIALGMTPQERDDFMSILGAGVISLGNGESTVQALISTLELIDNETKRQTILKGLRIMQMHQDAANKGIDWLNLIPRSADVQ